MKLSECVSILVFSQIYSYVCLGVVQSDLALSLEPTTLSSLESLSLDKSSGEVTAAQYVPLLYPSSDQSQTDPSIIQPSFTESFSGTENINQATLNRSICPSRTKNTAQDPPYQTTGKDYDLTKLLGSSKTAHQKTSAIEISSSSPISLTLQPHVSLSQAPVSSKTSTQETEPLHSVEWSLYDTMLKTQDSHEIQSQLAAMTITSSVFSTATSVMNTTKTSTGNNSCIPGPCPLSTDMCTPLKGGKFHCSCRQVYGRR